MLKNKILFVLLALFCSSTAYSFSITGSESYVKEMKEISSFKKLYISAGSMEVHLTQGNKTEVRLEGDKELVEQLDVRVLQGELDILYKPKHKQIKSSGLIKVYITTKNLTHITARGSVDIVSEKPWKLNALSFLLTGSGSVDMPVNLKSLVVQISGSSELKLTGSSLAQDVAVTGSGKYDGDELKSTTAKVVLSGSGSAVVFVKNALNVTIYGSGDVQYKGTPQIQSNIYGSGRIQKQNVL